MSDSYQVETRISLDDVHYGPLCPGERELQLIGGVEGKRVLELACGAAQNSIALAKWGASVTAMDFSPKQLRKAAQLIDQEKVGVSLVCGDMEGLSMFRDASFDMIVSSFGWEFVPDLQACFMECNRVLKRASSMIVCTVHPLSAFEWDEEEGALFVDNYFSPPIEVWEDHSDGSQPAATYFHTIQEMFDLLTSSGFVIERIVEPYPYPVPDMTNEEKSVIAYGGAYWEGQYERLSRIPFSIVYKAIKP